MLRIGGQKVPTPLLLLLAIDCFLIAVGLFLAAILRFSSASYGSVFHYLLTWQTFFRFLAVILVCEVSLYFNDLYDFRLMKTPSEMLVRLLQPSASHAWLWRFFITWTRIWD